MKWVNRLCALFLLLSLSPFSWSQDAWSPSSSAERIIDLTEQLDSNLQQQNQLIASLEKSNSEQQNLINQQLDNLKKSEESLRKQIALCQNLENLITDQATYQRKLEKKLLFWRITSGVLAACLTGTLVALGLSK